MSEGNADLKLLGLEKTLRLAHERLSWITRSVSDPAALKAAEDLWAKAATALADYKREGDVSRS